MNKPATDSSKKYLKARQIADKIIKEMSWIKAIYEIFKASGKEEISEKFLNTYAGHAWVSLRRAMLNEILNGISRVLVDEDKKVSSLHTLHELLKDQAVIQKIKENYTQGEGTFDGRLRNLMAAHQKLDTLMKSDTSVKRLLKHRHQYLAHNAQKTSKVEDRIKWGDEKELLDLLSDTIEPLEHLLLNSGNISGSTASAYRKYAKDFWDGFVPNKET